MSVTVAASTYHSSFIFANSSQRATTGSPNVAAAAPDTNATISAVSTPSNLSSALDQAGLSKGGISAGASDGNSDSDTAEMVRPNLDALNRVLSHYTAQSAATSTVLSLVG